MTKVDIRRLDSVTTNDTTATQLINENFEALQEAIENTISRDGTTPNFMDADLDLNSYKIINAGTPINNTDVITKEYFDEYVGNAAGFAEAAETSANRAATAAQAAQGYSTAASGAADVAQRARDFIESDPGFVAVSTDLLLGEDSSIKKTSEDLTNIDTVAGSIANVNAVGIDIANVNAVADDLTNIDNIVTNMTDINNVADDLTKIVAVADDLTKIDNVADDLTNINNVADDLTNIDTVADNITNVNAVANNETNINAVNANKTNIDTVATNIADVNSIAGDITKVTAVADDLTNIDAVNANKTNIDAVAGNNSNITAVAGNAANINAVNANKTNIDAAVANATNINTVAGDITNINAVAADLVNIDAASDYAAEAKQWAIGDPTEPVDGSAKYWAAQAAAGQINSNWTENDPVSKAYIQNKPTAGDNISLANNQISAVSDASPTQNSTNLVQSGGVFTVANSLQTQIDAIVASSDVFDIVGTYAELQAYDITTVPVNDIIKVLVDSTHSNAATYYRCVESGGVKSWSYIGSEGAYYTKGEADNKFSTITATGNSLDYTGNTLSLENSSGTVLSSVTINSTPDLDNKSITLNSGNELQTVGVINSRDTSTAVKTWTGTKAQYDAIVSKDANTQYMITDTGEIYLGTVNIGGSSRNIGEIIQSTIPLTDAGLHLLDGSVISGSGAYSAFVTYISGLVTDYPDLFTTEANWQNAVTTYGVCGKFVYDSTNNTVRLPKITGFTEGTIDPTVLGDLIQAGLPNIESVFVNHWRDNSSNKSLTPISGAISVKSDSYTRSTYPSTSPSNEGNYYNDQTLELKASLSNSIYGNSNTVQPQSIKVLYYIVIATSTKTDIEVDIDEVMTDLNGKVDKADLTACHVVVETYVNGSSWYRIWSDGWCEQGGRASVSEASTTTITYLKAFSNTNYTTQATQIESSVASDTEVGVKFNPYSTTQGKLAVHYINPNTTNVSWYACGKGA